MKFRVQVHRSFKLELEDAIHWYNRQKKGLGREFGGAVKETIKSLEAHPYAEIKYGNVRCRKVGKFPYLIHYTVDPALNYVYIFGIRHTSRDPDRIWVDET